ncbi:ribonuclease HIII [Streptococcus moroccensis]|uniref:Ribonuclease HIII n=1 Tax=Streptococcus moroccensis TaxID=1451356 RepID=A0ABT9YSK0_9STRE|nr:ribonuclease HIII [Streptococcus moroccensis]MDQ0222968.1 ribonuclease HIII [Streptococcus moroccensis]
MNPIVLLLTDDEISRLTAHYASYSSPNNDPYKKHFFKVNGTAISVYASGKVMFQGLEARALASQWQTTTDNHKKTSDRLSFTPSRVNQALSTVGSDEVGNGSYFGGIAVVASYVRPDQHSRLKALGVDDSKSLTDIKILQIAPILEKEIAHQALLLSPSKYNEVVPSRHNAVSVKVALHNQALYLLLQKIETPEQIIIDAFTSSQNYKKYVANEPNQLLIPVQLIEKAESQCLAVAVSSIIARAMFLDQLNDLGEQVGYKLPSGAGPASDKVAAQLLQAYGRSSLHQTAKLHFKNTEKAEKLVRRS